jgi:hypothetical protein
MTKQVLTQLPQIQSFLEELTSKAESRNAELKQQLEELSAKPVIQQSLVTEVKFRDNVILRIGTTKFDRHIRSTTKYAELISTVSAAIGHACQNVAFRDAQGRLLWVRTNQDVHFMFASFFAEEVPFRQINVIQPEELASLLNLPLRKEFTFKEGMPVFRVECSGEESPLIYLTIPANSTMEEALEHFESIFGPITSLTVDDPSDDRIAIDNNEAWEYCLEAATAMTKAGKYLLVRIEATPPE